MSDPNRPGDVPPDLPPEYAEAYRRGYERALARSGDDETESPEPASTQATAEFQPLFADELEPDPKPEIPRYEWLECSTPACAETW